MDYMREINAFYDWLETNTLSANAVLTWHALMHTNNKCFWKNEFGVAISVLALKTGGVSRRGIERARNELEQKGLIQWKERPGSQSAVYTMVPFVRLCDAQPVVQPVAQVDAQPVVQPVAQVDAITSYPTDTQKTKTKTNTKARVSPSGFDLFWAAYPRKTAKAEAKKAFCKINPDADMLSVMLDAVDTQKRGREWQSDDGKYIPHARTWLNQERWLDESSQGSAGPRIGDRDDLNRVFDGERWVQL